MTEQEKQLKKLTQQLIKRQNQQPDAQLEEDKESSVFFWQGQFWGFSNNDHLGKGSYGEVFKVHPLDSQGNIQQHDCEYIVKISEINNETFENNLISSNYITNQFYPAQTAIKFHVNPDSYYPVEYCTIMQNMGNKNLHDQVENCMSNTSTQLSFKQKISVVVQLFGQLSLMHDNTPTNSKTIHNDIKPSNVVLKTSNASETQASLIDFDIAQQNKSISVIPNPRPESIGTSYHPPEAKNDLFKQICYSQAGDIYSLTTAILSALGVRNYLFNQTYQRLPTGKIRGCIPRDKSFDLREYIIQFLNHMQSNISQNRPSVEIGLHFFQLILQHCQIQELENNNTTGDSPSFETYKFRIQARIKLLAQGIWHPLLNYTLNMPLLPKHPFQNVHKDPFEADRKACQRIVEDDLCLTSTRVSAYLALADLKMHSLENLWQQCFMNNQAGEAYFKAITGLSRLQLLTTDHVNKLLQANYSQEALEAIYALSYCNNGQQRAQNILENSDYYTPDQLQTIIDINHFGYNFDKLVDCICPINNDESLCYSNSQLHLIQQYAKETKRPRQIHNLDDFFYQILDPNQTSNKQQTFERLTKAGCPLYAQHYHFLTQDTDQARAYRYFIMTREPNFTSTMNYQVFWGLTQEQTPLLPNILKLLALPEQTQDANDTDLFQVLYVIGLNFTSDSLAMTEFNQFISQYASIEKNTLVANIYEHFGRNSMQIQAYHKLVDLDYKINRQLATLLAQQDDISTQYRHLLLENHELDEERLPNITEAINVIAAYQHDHYADNYMTDIKGDLDLLNSESELLQQYFPQAYTQCRNQLFNNLQQYLTDRLTQLREHKQQSKCAGFFQPSLSQQINRINELLRYIESHDLPVNSLSLNDASNEHSNPLLSQKTDIDHNRINKLITQTDQIGQIANTLKTTFDNINNIFKETVTIDLT